MSAAGIVSTTLVAATSGSIIRGTEEELLIRTKGQQTGSEVPHVVIHSPIVSELRIHNSPGRTANLAAPTATQPATGAELALATLIAVQQGDRVATELLRASGHRVEKELVRAIDPEARRIAAVEIELAVATWEVVLAIVAVSEVARDTVAAMRAQAAVEVLIV